MEKDVNRGFRIQKSLGARARRKISRTIKENKLFGFFAKIRRLKKKK